MRALRSHRTERVPGLDPRPRASSPGRDAHRVHPALQRAPASPWSSTPSVRTAQRSDLCSPVVQRHRPSRRVGWDRPRVPRRRVVQLHVGPIVYTSGRSVCGHPPLAVSIGRPGDDIAIAARHAPPSTTIRGDLSEAGLHLALRRARSEYWCPTPSPPRDGRGQLSLTDLRWRRERGGPRGLRRDRLRGFCFELLSELEGFRNVEWRKGTPKQSSDDNSERDIVAKVEKARHYVPGHLIGHRVEVGVTAKLVRSSYKGAPAGLYGPYLQWTRTAEGKTLTRLLPEELAARYRGSFDNTGGAARDVQRARGPIDSRRRARSPGTLMRPVRCDRSSRRPTSVERRPRNST